MTEAPFTAVLKCEDAEALWQKLEASGWADLHKQRTEIDDIISDKREWAFQREHSETRLTVFDQGNYVGVVVQLIGMDEWSDEVGKPVLLFEGYHMTIHRMFALLHVLGIVRADATWLAWYDTEIWP